MTSRDKAKFAELLESLGELFNEPVSTVRAQLYFDALAAFSIEQVILAACRIGETQRFFPKPVDFREIIIGTSEDQAELAWAHLLREVRREGYTGKPALPEETWAAVDALWGSWQHACETVPADGPGLASWSARFRAIYSAQERRAEQAALPPSPLLKLLK